MVAFREVAHRQAEKLPATSKSLKCKLHTIVPERPTSARMTHIRINVTTNACDAPQCLPIAAAGQLNS